MEDKLALRQVVRQLLRVFPLSTIQKMPHILQSTTLYNMTSWQRYCMEYLCLSLSCFVLPKLLLTQ